MIRVGFSTCKTNVLSRIIRWFTKSQASHAWLLVEGSFLGMDMVMEATEGGFRITPYETFKKGHDIVAVLDTAFPLDSGVRTAAAWLGERYDYLGLFGSAFVMLGRWMKRKWKNPLDEPHAMFCSEAVAFIIKESGYPGSESMDPSSTTPQDLMDFLSSKA